MPQRRLLLFLALLPIGAILAINPNQHSYSSGQKRVYETPPDRDHLPNPIPPPQAPYYQRYDISINRIQETGRHCFNAYDCPSQAICYLNKCYCQVGYQYINSTNQCWRKPCDPFRSDCPFYFANSECTSMEVPSPAVETSGHCTCLYSFRVNSFALSCQDLYQITPTYVWYKVLGYLMLTLVLPVIGGLVALAILSWIVYLVWQECSKKKEKPKGYGGSNRRLSRQGSRAASLAEVGRGKSDESEDEEEEDDVESQGDVHDRELDEDVVVVEPMNREPRRAGGAVTGPETSFKSSTASIGRTSTPIPVTHGKVRYYQQQEYRSTTSPV